MQTEFPDFSSKTILVAEDDEDEFEDDYDEEEDYDE